MDAYTRLARHLDALPNGFPLTESGVELRILARIFSPEDAELASRLRLTPETPAQVAARLGGDARELGHRLKDMARRGQIAVARTDQGLAYGALPFVFGIYEYQVGTLDREFAQLFEDYYREAFGRELARQPQIHRVIPVEEAVEAGIEIRPFESAAGLLAQAKAWGVLDCICRKQKSLLGEACEHPVDVCMAFSPMPGAFDGNPVIQALTLEQAQAVLGRAAEAGLVHSVSNSQHDVGYICNCCTCSCGILRGLAELGIADAVARSAFVMQVDEGLCVGCDLCLERCQFRAMALDGVVHINSGRCVGCGVCALACPERALVLRRRDDAETTVPPLNEHAWREQRARARGIDLEAVT
jgi:Fe-S-cluster-containing hydrogenase component 2